MNQQPLVELEDIRFRWPGQPDDIIQIDHLAITATERLFIQGASGAGKSTLLNLISGVLKPQTGVIQLLGHQFSHLNQSARDRLRADHIGYIFQQFNLIPYLSILENVMLPCRFSRARRDKAMRRSGSLSAEATQLIKRLFGQSGPELNRQVTELSVGQQQRVAVARALIGQPELVIADEPTSSLDVEARRDFMELLFEEVNRNQSALLFVSHDPGQKHWFERYLNMSDLQNRVKP